MVESGSLENCYGSNLIVGSNPTPSASANYIIMKRGFTIIELLVSVAIIALLTAIVMVSISTTKSKNRDTNRMSQLHEINNALNLYHTGNQRFPIYTGNITGTDAMSTVLENSGAISEVPIDPLNSAPYIYTYTSADGTNFSMGFCLETDTIQGYSQGCGNIITP